MSRPSGHRHRRPHLPHNWRRAPFNRADLFVLLVALGAGVLAVRAAVGMAAPLAELSIQPVSLDPALLPGYGLRTTLRMFAAMGCSLLFALAVGTLAARSRRAAQAILPMLDILQSVPILGFLTFTVTFFMGRFPGRQLGVELAAIFAIFTSQAWNMAFSVYQSLRSVPPELEEVARSFRLSPLHRFFRLDLPATIPGLVWNMMMSMSGGWFFIVAAEAITVGNTSVALPGVGSWLALAIARQDLGAVGWAVAAMATIIALYDQLLFRPLVAFADRFRADDTPGAHRPKSWAYELLLRTRLVPLLFRPLGRALFRLCLRLQPAPASDSARRRQQRRRDQREWMWRGVLAMIGLGSLVIVGAYVREQLNLAGVAGLFMLACFTLARVLVLIALASLIWVPAGVWIGLRPVWAARLQPVAQFLAAFPANILFPVAVAAIVHLHLDANVWLSPLMVLGTQWYILFNVIAGASLIPQDLLDVARLAGLDGWRWWTRLALPAVFPYYVTGALTASGGSWNASIVAELVNWGDVRLKAAGLGSFIAEATAAGDYHQVALGIAMMALFVIGLNQLLWRPLYRLAERRLRPPA